MMRLLFSFLLLLLLPATRLAAQAPAAGLRVAAGLREVTVYEAAAELRHTATCQVPAGSSDLVLTGLSGAAQALGLQVQVEGGELLATSLLRVRPLGTLSDSARRAGQQLQRLEAEREALTAEKDFLLCNQQVPATTPAAWTAALQTGATYYHTRIFDLTLKLSALAETLAAQQAELTRLQARPAGSAGAVSRCEVALRVRRPQAGAVRVAVSYLVPGSGWAPRHELRVREPGQPLEVVNRALVYNQSGLDWAAVRVTLLSANPSSGALRPRLDPWTLNFSGGNLAEGRLDSYAVKGTKPGTEAEPAAEGAEAFGERFGVAEAVSVATGSSYLVQLGSVTAAATYEYLTVPKLDPGAFLLAKVADWEKLKLLADSATVYLQGAYAGSTLLNAAAYGDTLELALGRDPLVKVTRTKRADRTTTTLLGNRRLTLRYEVVVKNQRRAPIELRVLDQVPVSQHETIKVEHGELSGAQLDEESGRLTWLLKLAANESRQLPFEFTIEYPRRKKNFALFRAKTRSPKFR